MIGDEVVAVYVDDGDGYELQEVQKIVRCKDCRHWWTSGCIDMFGQCELDGYVKNQSDFCSKGEHEETGHE